MLKDRKIPPPQNQGLFTDQAIKNWRKSQGRRIDTFIGITNLSTNQFHLFPAFVIKTNSGHNDDNVVTTYIGNELKRFAGTLGEVKETYGAENVVVIEPRLGGGFGGLAHADACRKVSLTPNDVIGWSIVGNDNTQVGNDNTQGRFSYYIRFVSGRNTDKFTQRRTRQDDEADRDGRDLPKAWADWVKTVIENDLSILALGSERVGNSEGKTSKKADFYDFQIT